MKIERYDFPFREDADMYLPFVFRYGVVLVAVATIVSFAFSFLYPEFFLITFILGNIGLLFSVLSFLWYRNTTLVIVSEDEFVYRTFLGNIYKFRFSEIIRINDGLGGMRIIFPNKKIYIDGGAVVSEKLRNKIYDVKKRIGNAPNVELPTFSHKSDDLRKNFRRR